MKGCLAPAIFLYSWISLVKGYDFALLGQMRNKFRIAIFTRKVVLTIGVDLIKLFWYKFTHSYLKATPFHYTEK
jgi:hypothetical protein